MSFIRFIFRRSSNRHFEVRPPSYLFLSTMAVFPCQLFYLSPSLCMESLFLWPIYLGLSPCILNVEYEEGPKANPSIDGLSIS
jgi:hypothetical protein